MRKKALPALASCLALLLAALVEAGEPWKEKPYTEWTSEEARDIMTDSPWVRTVHVDAPWIKGAPHFLQMLPPSCSGRIDASGPRRPPPQWTSESMPLSVVAFQVSWESSRTLRAARLRFATLCRGAERDEEMESEFLSQERDDYMISMSAPDMQPFDPMEEESLKQNTYLLLKKNKQKIAPARWWSCAAPTVSPSIA